MHEFTQQVAFTSFSLMKLLPGRWLCLLSVCCSTSSAAPQKELQSERRKAHNICDLLRSRNIRSISVTLWLVWWVPAVPPDLHIQYSDPRAHKYTHLSTHMRHTLSARCYAFTNTRMCALLPPVHESPSTTCLPVSLTINNDLSGAVKPATKIKIPLYVTAQYACVFPVLTSSLSLKTDAVWFVWFRNTSIWCCRGKKAELIIVDG